MYRRLIPQVVHQTENTLSSENKIRMGREMGCSCDGECVGTNDESDTVEQKDQVTASEGE